ncbi:MAG TPA: biotin/lipoyl-containing protein, partial [Magnetospirillum sp.]|nr:biotin/lipoyl-containing protein [Magnetospirillum sp.]
MTTKITVPTLGESITEATVAKWLKNVGDVVKADEPIVELETDKVTAEVPSPAAGVLTEILVQAGATVEIGAELGLIGAGSGAAAAPAKAAAPAVAAAPAPVAAPAAPAAAPAFPSAAKLASEAGVNTAGIAGSGKGDHRGVGRVVAQAAGL